MQCPYCKNNYISYAVLESHLEWHGCTSEEAQRMIERIKQENILLPSQGGAKNAKHNRNPRQ